MRRRMPKSARSFSTTLFTMIYAKNNLSHSRFGFVVSKKVDARAVVRNRLRRSVRACIEEIMMRIVPGMDMQFIMKKQSLTIEQEALSKVVKDALVKEKLMA